MYLFWGQLSGIVLKTDKKEKYNERPKKKRMDWAESYNKCVLKNNNNKIAFKS